MNVARFFIGAYWRTNPLLQLPVWLITRGLGVIPVPGAGMVAPTAVDGVYRLKKGLDVAAALPLVILLIEELVDVRLMVRAASCIPTAFCERSASI